MDYLPSKNFVKIVGSFLVILGLGWLVLFLWNKNKTPAENPTDIQVGKQNTNTKAEAQKDTDNDGLKDWEEALWRTNPEITDTDGDATIDGDEVKAGRNPVIVGLCEKKCSDKLQSPEEVAKKNDPGSPSTFTAKIAQEFGKNYFAGKGLVEGKSLSASTQQSLADSITLGIEQGVAAYQDIFKKEDLKISKFLSPKIYLDKLGDAFNKNFSAVGGSASGGKNILISELNIMGIVLSEGYFSADDGSSSGGENVKLFDPLITAYKNMALFLQKESVPESYAELHIEVLNIMQNILFAVRGMKNIEEDPIKAIVGVRLYAKEIERTAKFLKNLKKQIEKDEIKFDEQDGGWFFMKYINSVQ